MENPPHQNNPEAFPEPSQGIAGHDAASKPVEASQAHSKPATPNASNPVIDPVKATDSQNNSIDPTKTCQSTPSDTTFHSGIQHASNTQHKKKVHEGIDPVTRKFMPGNQLGKHNSPHLAKITQLRQAIFQCTSVDDMVDVWNALKKKAKAGYIAHQKLFLAYSVGEPTQRVEAVIANLTENQVQLKIDSLFGVKENEDTVNSDNSIEVDVEVKDNPDSTSNTIPPEQPETK
jgi:hypothetical protein